MSLKNFYQTLPHDSSGSMAKNRFGYEMAVGVEKLIENYDKHDNYTVVFDHVCDIEIHYDNEFKFYQVKTSKTLLKFDVGYLTSKNKKKYSIIGTLYKLHGDNVNLYIVGNIPFYDDNKFVTDINGLSFSKMSIKTKKAILEQLKSEKIIEDDVLLDDVYYVYNPLNIRNYDETLLGRLINFYNDKIDKNIVKPKILYSMLKDVVVQRACCEEYGDSYQEILKAKGISKKEFQELMQVHKKNSNNIIEKCITEYKNCHSNDIAGNLKITKSLSKIIENNNYETKQILSKIELNIEKEILNFSGSLDEFIKYYLKKFEKIFSPDDDYYDKYSYVLYQYVRIMEV